MERVDVRHALYPLSALEADACQNAVQLSRHTRLKMLTNHHMNTEGELQGYVFTCIKKKRRLGKQVHTKRRES